MVSDETAVMVVRAGLVIELEKTPELIKELNIPLNYLSEILNHKAQKLSIDRLAFLLLRLGKRVEVRVYSFLTFP